MEVIQYNNQQHQHPYVDYQRNNKYYYDPSLSLEEQNCASSIAALSKRLEEEIRAAKRTHLTCGEVLLPCGLLQKVAEDIFQTSDPEPCGIRGCTLYLLFEGEEDCRRISNVKIDPTMPSTYELYLTFKQSNAGWTFLPQFLKKITRGGTIMISSDYELTKKKLYRSPSGTLSRVQ